MIRGMGVDLVDICRFDDWHKRSHASLRRIFTKAEIAYCTSLSLKSAERFAARFALKEATYKACCHAGILSNIPFLTFARALEISLTPLGAPHLAIEWKKLPGEPSLFMFHASVSHSKKNVVAIVMISSGF